MVSGPDVQPYLYQLNDPDLFLIGTTNENKPKGDPSVSTKLPNDLPRAQSTLGLLGDSRNDENLIVAQLHLAFLKFHNKIVAGIRDKSIKPQYSTDKSVFYTSQRIGDLALSVDCTQRFF